MKNSYNRVGLTARLRQLGLVAVLAGAAGAAHGQALPYTAANVTNYLNPVGFVELTTGTVINTGGNFDNATAAVTMPAGFAFSFNGTARTSFFFNTNGFLQFGAAAPAAATFPTYAQNVQIGGALATLTDVVSPLNADLEAGSSTPEYRYDMTGTAPFRVMTIQWKNVSDKPRPASAAGAMVIDKQYANFSFQVKLYETTNSIDFVYGTATVALTGVNNANFTSVGLKGSGVVANQVITVIKPSNIPWNQAIFQQGPYVTAGANNSNGVNLRREAIIPGGQVTPEPGRTFNFAIPVSNDAATQVVYGFNKLTVPSGQPATIQARVRNTGTTALSNVVATLTVTGANAGAVMQTVASLPVGGNAVVNFPNVDLRNPGTNTLTVRVANDANNSNNAASMTMVTDPTTTSFITPNAPSVNGFTGGQDTYFAAKVTYSTSRDIVAVRAFIGDADPIAGSQISTVGQTVYGVVVDAVSGALRARSANYVVTAADVDVVHTFTLQSPTTVTGDVLIGMAMVVDPAASGRFFPMGVQSEVPTRDNTFFSGTVGGNAPMPALTMGTSNQYKYMLEVNSTAPATCATPNNIVLSNATQTTVQVAFTGPSNGTAYEVVYVPAGTTPTVGSLTSSPFTTSPYTLTMLTPGTGYDIYVRALCGATDRSGLAGPSFFSTPCAPPTINNFPYTQNFDLIANGQDLPCGIKVTDDNADGSTWEPTNSVTSGVNLIQVARSQPYAMVYVTNADGTTAADDWFYLPAMRFTAGSRRRLSFYYRNNTRPGLLDESLEVKYGLGATPAGQTTLLYNNPAIATGPVTPTSVSYTLADNTTNPAVADIAPTATGLYYIGFHANSQADRGFLAVDDINVSAVLASSEALARAVSVYPNPSNTGSFKLDIAGANAKGGLQVEVSNMLGQRVYTSTAKDNFSNELNLSNLAAGIYSLKVKNGTEYMQQQISIVK